MTTRTVTESPADRNGLGSGGALVRSQGFQALVSSPIRTTQDLVSRARELAEVAHVLSPYASTSSIPVDIAIDPVVVIIDPRVDPATGRGQDCYFSRSIHKSRKEGQDSFIPTEVSLNKIGLLKMLRAAGVNIVESRRTDDGRDPHYCAWTTRGQIREIDGSWRDLPPGDAEMDLRDGSAAIGEWTPAKWVTSEHEAEAERIRRKLNPGESWKVKPEPVGGFTMDRVLQQRRKIVALAQTFSLERLARNLGVQQIYSIADLAKPFVFMRATYAPDMTDPEVRRLVTLSRLGALATLYPNQAALPPAVAAVGPTPAPPVEGSQEEPQTAAPPADAEVLTTWPEPGKKEAAATPFDPVFVTRVLKQGDRWFAETKLGAWTGRPGPTYTTTDEGVARVLFQATQSRVGLDVDDELVEVAGQPYRQVVNVVPVSLDAPNLPGLGNL
jgi:hypothetical protein